MVAAVAPWKDITRLCGVNRRRRGSDTQIGQHKNSSPKSCECLLLEKTRKRKKNISRKMVEAAKVRVYKWNRQVWTDYMIFLSFSHPQNVFFFQFHCVQVFNPIKNMEKTWVLCSFAVGRVAKSKWKEWMEWHAHSRLKAWRHNEI